MPKKDPLHYHQSLSLPKKDPPPCISESEAPGEFDQPMYLEVDEQEQMLGLDLFKTKYPYLKTTVFRPRALSFGKTMIPSITRQQLASDILDCAEKIDSKE